MRTADAQLRGANVMMVANTYQPATIYRDLVNGVVGPTGCRIVNSIQSLDGCRATYDNAIDISVNPQRLGISKEYREQFALCSNNEVYALAAKFVEAYKLVSYQAIGLNWLIAMSNDDPLQWMTQKFLKVKSQPKDIFMMPQFVVRAGKSVLTLSFKQEISYDGQREPQIVVDCNYHNGGPFENVADILHMLDGWKNARNIALSKLEDVLGLE